MDRRQFIIGSGLAAGVAFGVRDALAQSFANQLVHSSCRSQAAA